MLYLVKQCFFSEWQGQAEEVYKTCVGINNSSGNDEGKEKEEGDENLSEENMMAERDAKFTHLSNTQLPQASPHH
jgi:hypothetical protein